jgi:hypothetical protein
MFSNSATVNQRDLQPIHQLIKSITHYCRKINQQNYFTSYEVFLHEMRHVQPARTANNGRHFSKMDSSFTSCGQNVRSFGQVDILHQIACNSDRNILIKKSNLRHPNKNLPIKFHRWKCKLTPQFRTEFGIHFQSASRETMAKISSSQRHSRHLVAGGHDFSHLPTAKRLLHELPRTERMDGLLSELFRFRSLTSRLMRNE